MATVSVYATVTATEGHKVKYCGVVPTSNYNRVTGDYIQYSDVDGANAIIMVTVGGLTNGGMAAAWQNSGNALFFYGDSNVGATGSYNGIVFTGAGNVTNFATHLLPVTIVCKGD